MNKSLLVAIDGSYVIYYAIFRAIRIWTSRNKKEASFLCEETVDADLLKNAIDATGYVCEKVTSEAYEKKGWFR